MKALDAILTLNNLAASQRGLFTSAQARSFGVTKVDLARLADRGQIVRLRHGVYRAGGAPSTREEDVLAAWISLEPSTPSYLRDVGPDGFTASLNTAAWLHGFGELNATPMVFSHPGRRQTRKFALQFIKRELAKCDIVIVAGIPATSPTRTIIDLVRYGEDLSLTASVLNDALVEGGIPDEELLSREIDGLAVKRGFEPGYPLYNYLRRQ